MLEYLLGLVTLPALAGLAILGLRAWWTFEAFAERHGYSVDGKMTRRVAELSDYVLRNDIWFERARGPIFTGHWCRTSYSARTGYDRRLLATRWIGVGSVDGPCVTFYKVRDLGPVAE